jgi:hypothetical protein
MQLASLQFMRRTACSGRSATRQIVSQHLSRIQSKNDCLGTRAESAVGVGSTRMVA